MRISVRQTNLSKEGRCTRAFSDSQFVVHISLQFRNIKRMPRSRLLRIWRQKRWWNSSEITRPYSLQDMVLETCPTQSVCARFGFGTDGNDEMLALLYDREIVWYYPVTEASPVHGGSWVTWWCRGGRFKLKILHAAYQGMQLTREVGRFVSEYFGRC